MGSSAKNRHGWAKGLIHFHTDYSDGGATVAKATDMAKDLGYAFLIVTDHLQNLPRLNRRFEEYVAACTTVSSSDFLVIPGGELESTWARGADHSEAHTLALSIRDLLADLVWSPAVEPYAHWKDSAGGTGTIQAIQQMLLAHGLPPAASHQFQHAYLGTSIHTDEHADYRYDLSRLKSSRLLDFFYSGFVDAAHEPDDFAFYLSRLNEAPSSLPAIYASCDYHFGPETLKELLLQHRTKVIEVFCRVLIQRAGRLGNMICWLLRRRPEYVLGVIERRIPLLFQLLKGVPPIGFAAEQLSHATYVYLGDEPFREDTVLRALGEGRTCVTRGTAEFRNLQPVPGSLPAQNPSIMLDLPKTYSVHRPRNVLIYRDGVLLDWLTIPDTQQTINLTWTDPHPLTGIHNYVVYVPSKFLTSPIIFDVQ